MNAGPRISETVTLPVGMWMGKKCIMTQELVEALSTPGFTPEPWTVERTPLSASLRIVSPGESNGGWIIGTLYGPDAEANSRLVTNGQRMLETLKKLTGYFKNYLEWAGGSEGDYESIHSAEELINQVEGKI